MEGRSDIWGRFEPRKFQDEGSVVSCWSLFCMKTENQNDWINLDGSELQQRRWSSVRIWLGSIPIISLFWGMKIHKSQRFWCSAGDSPMVLIHSSILWCWWNVAVTSCQVGVGLAHQLDTWTAWMESVRKLWGDCPTIFILMAKIIFKSIKFEGFPKKSIRQR